MTLSELRTQIIATSGRYDFTTVTGETQLNYLINSAIRFIEQRTQSETNYITRSYVIPANDDNVTIDPSLRTIERVMIAVGSEPSYELSRADYKDWESDSATYAVAYGSPTFYAPITKRYLGNYNGYLNNEQTTGGGWDLDTATYDTNTQKLSWTGEVNTIHYGSWTVDSVTGLYDNTAEYTGSLYIDLDVVQSVGTWALTMIILNSAGDPIYPKDAYEALTVFYNGVSLPQGAYKKQLYVEGMHSILFQAKSAGTGDLIVQFNSFNIKQSYPTTSVQTDAESVIKYTGSPIETRRAISVLPAPTSQSILSVYGKQHSQELKDDEDENKWTIEYPEIVELATLYEIETRYRNTEGANDWLAQLEVKMHEIYRDAIEDEWNGYGTVRNG